MSLFQKAIGRKQYLFLSLFITVLTETLTQTVSLWHLSTAWLAFVGAAALLAWGVFLACRLRDIGSSQWLLIPVALVTLAGPVLLGLRLSPNLSLVPWLCFLAQLPAILWPPKGDTRGSKEMA